MQKISLIIITCCISLPFFGQITDSSSISGKGIFIGREKTLYHTIGNKKIPLKVIKYMSNTDIVLLCLHDDETTSVTAAKSVLSRTGGVLLRISNNNTRLISFTLGGKKYRFDPNRMFSRVGIRQNLKELNRSYAEAAVLAIEKFAQFLLANLPKNTPTLIAIHNNRNGGYSAESYMRGDVYENDIDDHLIHEVQDKDNFLLTTDKKLFKELKPSGYNLLLQDNKKAREDGSLSVYYGRKKKSYLNVETELGQLEEQVRMINAVVGALD